jgi:hypothetical protein
MNATPHLSRPDMDFKELFEPANVTEFRKRSRYDNYFGLTVGDLVGRWAHFIGGFVGKED